MTDYRTIRLKEVKDVAALKKCILKHGHFTMKDYILIMNRAKRSAFRKRIELRLKKEIEPLLYYTPNNEDTNGTKDEASELQIKQDALFKTKHKASEFIMKEGEIRIGDWVLESKRINKTDPCWLELIEHDFTIAPEHGKPFHFHFVPYNDLSFLLNAINKEQELIRQQIRYEEEQAELNKFIDFKPELIRAIDNYLLYHRIHLEDEDIKIYDIENKKIFNILCAFKIAEKNDYKTFCSLYSNQTVSVPLDDVSIADKTIKVKTEHIKLFNSEDWDSLKSYLFFAKELTIEFLDKWENRIRQILERRKKYHIKKLTQFKEIEIVTNVSRKTFRQAFVNPYKDGISINNTRIIKPEELLIPISFLKHEKNHGAVLFSYAHGNLYNILSSEPFTFSQKILTEFNNKKNECFKLYNLKTDRHWLNTEVTNLRRLNKEYLKLNNSSFSKKFDSNLYAIRFKENFKHFSSEYYQTHESIISWSENRSDVYLSTKAPNYAIYKFFVKKDYCKVLAAYVIMKYFSSTINNKRESFTITKEMKFFGIQAFCRL